LSALGCCCFGFIAESTAVAIEAILGRINFGKIADAAHRRTDLGEIWVVIVHGWVMARVWRRKRDQSGDVRIVRVWGVG
jgi:hypothetical protein